MERRGQCRLVLGTLQERRVGHVPVQVTSVTVMVRFPPSVQLKVISTDRGQVLKEGMPLKLICQAEGNPSNFRYKWTVDGDEGESRLSLLDLINFCSAGRSSLWSAEEEVFMIPSLTREMEKMVVACTATNSEGSGTDDTKIDVTCQ